MLIYTVRSNQSTSKFTHSEIPTTRSLEHITEAWTDSILSQDTSLVKEDAEAHYITSAKHLLRNMEPDALNALYKDSEPGFPLLELLLKCSRHPDVMIRNAARICLMIVFQKCQGEAMEYVTSAIVPDHVRDIVTQLKKTAVGVQSFYERSDAAAMKNSYLSYEEELEYADDILRLCDNSKRFIIDKIFNEFIDPFLVSALFCEEQPVEYQSPLSCKIGLCLFSKLLQTITDPDLKEYIQKFILRENEFPAVKISSKLVIKRLKQLVLFKHKADGVPLYALFFLQTFQYHILERRKAKLKAFYEKFLCTLLKLLPVSYHFDPTMKYLQLKLLSGVFKPLVQNIATDGIGWLKLGMFFSQAIEILYTNTSKEIQRGNNNLVGIIDREYEAYSHFSVDVGKILVFDANYLTEDCKCVIGKSNSTKITLYHLFCIRNLHLALKNEKETLLPLIKREEQIGNVMFIGDCMPCKKLICDNIYSSKHFLKITDTQLLVLQSTGKEMEGIVIFNAYYKDIIWSTGISNTLKICAKSNCTLEPGKDISKPLSTQLQFEDEDDLEFLSDILIKAKFSQIKTAYRRLKQLLQPWRGEGEAAFKKKSVLIKY